jgi:hypothetical protein
MQVRSANEKRKMLASWRFAPNSSVSQNLEKTVNVQNAHFFQDFESFERQSSAKRCYAVNVQKSWASKTLCSLHNVLEAHLFCSVLYYTVVMM